MKIRGVPGEPRLVGPPAGPRNSYQQAIDLSVRLPAGDAYTMLTSPFLVHSGLWHSIGERESARLAYLLQQQGILVCGLAEDVGGTAAAVRLTGCVYTPERFGLRRGDLRNASFLELQLGAQRGLDPFGRHRPDEVARYIPENRAVREVTAITARSWPPDVASRETLSTKLQQLRRLSDQPVSIALAVAAHDWELALELAVASGADAVLLEFPSSGGVFPDADDFELVVSVRARLNDLERDASREIVLAVTGPVEGAGGAAVLLAAGARLIGVDAFLAAAFQAGESHANSKTPLMAAPPPGAADKGSEEMVYLLEDLATALAACDIGSLSSLRPHHVAIGPARWDATS